MMGASLDHADTLAPVNPIAVYRSTVLPASETFIHDQMLAMRGVRPVLLGLARARGGLDVSLLDCVIHDRSRMDRWFSGARLLLGRPHPGLVATLRSLKPMLVHAHFGTDAVDAWPSVRALGLPMLVTLHGYDIHIQPEWWRSGQGGWRRRFYPDRLISMARHPDVGFLAVSQSIRDKAVASGIPQSKIRIAHVGIDTSRFLPEGPPVASRAPRVLFVGRMVEKKAPLLMVQAFAKVAATVPGAELMMIGDGPLLEPAEHLARSQGLRIDFPGKQTPSQVLAHLNQSRVMCLPSVTASNGDAEGFGLVLLEAQACGLPVVTSALGGATEGMIDQVTGLRVPEGDAERLSQALIRVLTDDTLAASMSENAIAFVHERFRLEDCTRNLESHYDQFLADRFGK